jgi:hypothetical protein
MPSDAQLDPEFQQLLDTVQGKSSSIPWNTKAANAAAMTHGGTGGYDPANSAWMQRWGPTAGMSTPALALAGAGQGLTDVARHAGNLVGLESDQDLRNAKALDAPLLGTGAGRLGQFVGQTAALAPVGMGAGAALGRMGALGARLAANPIASGAIQGAGQGALMADPGERGKGALMGGALGTSVPALAAGLGKAAYGVSRTPEAQLLLDRGIDLTPGQMNPRGMANRMEQAAEGALGVGDLIQNARQNAMGQYSRAALQDAMPAGQKLAGAGDFNELIDEAAAKFDTAYDGAKGFPVGAKIMQVQGPDIPLSKALQQVAAKPRIGLTADARSDWGQQLNDQLNEVIKTAKATGGMQSDHLIAFRSAIRDALRGENGTDNASRAARSLLQDANDKVTQALESQLPTDVAQTLRQTDQQYARFSILRNAAVAAKDAPGGPTPFQISTAIAKATPPNAYARGAGAGRDLSKAAMDTFQNNVPRTGLAGVGRLALPAAALGGVGLAHPAALALPAGMAALTLTQTGRKLAAGNTAAQKWLQGLLGNVQGTVPANVRNLPGLYARSGLLSGAAPRLQQMPAQADQ